MPESTRNNLILLFFILLKFILQYQMIDPEYELHRDEYLHLDQARHLAWGFTSVPPVTSWISMIIMLLGNGVFWVKFFPALFGALTMLLVWRSVEALKGGLFACVLAMVAMLCSPYMRINTLYQPNSLDILCWTFVLFCIIRFIGSQKDKWLYLLATGFAFGFLNKYNIGFLVVGLLPALLLTEHRKLFTRRAFYLAAGLALLIILPNLVWQLLNGLPVIHHMNELSLTQLVNVKRDAFIKEQFALFLPSIVAIVFSWIGMVSYKPFRPYRIIGWTFLFTILVFVYLKGKAYYALGLYPVLFAFGSVYLEELTRRRRKYYWRPAIILFILALGMFYIPLTNPVFSPERIKEGTVIHKIYKATGQLRWEDGRQHHLPQDYADMIGWREIARLADKARLSLSAEEWEQTLVVCDNYGQAGAINYYAEEYPAAVSMSADYKNWFPGGEKTIKNILLIQYANKPHPEMYSSYFTSIDSVGSVTNTMAREYGTAAYLLRNAYKPWNGITFRKWISE